MKIEIEGIERECEVVLAPKGSFCVFDVNEGIYGFPEFIIIAPAMTGKEKSCGNIVTCPVVCGNAGYENAHIDRVMTEIRLDDFKQLLIGYYKSYEVESISAVAIMVYDEFLRHGTIVSPELKYYMDAEVYNRDKDFMEIEKGMANV